MKYSKPLRLILRFLFFGIDANNCFICKIERDLNFLSIFYLVEFYLKFYLFYSEEVFITVLYCGFFVFYSFNLLLISNNEVFYLFKFGLNVLKLLLNRMKKSLAIAYYINLSF